MLAQTISIGLKRQLRVISALLIREVRIRNGKQAFGQLFELLEAVGFILAHWIIFSYLHRSLLIGDSLLLFITTGILPILLFRTITIKTSQSIEASKAVVNIPYIEAIDYAVARAVVELISYTLLFMMFFAMISLFDVSDLAIPSTPIRVPEVLGILIFFAFGVGLVNSFITYIFPPWKYIWGMLSRVQIFFSAVFFIPEYMPPAIKNIIAYNPLLHLVALFRTAFYPTYPTHLLSVSYLLKWTAASVILGLALERALRRHRLG